MELPIVLKAACDVLGISPTGPDQENPRKVSYYGQKVKHKVTSRKKGKEGGLDCRLLCAKTGAGSKGCSVSLSHLPGLSIGFHPFLFTFLLHVSWVLKKQNLALPEYPEWKEKCPASSCLTLSNPSYPWDAFYPSQHVRQPRGTDSGKLTGDAFFPCSGNIPIVTLITSPAPTINDKHLKICSLQPAVKS